MKLIQTDHREQALVLDDTAKLIISEAINFFYSYKIGAVELRQKALCFLTNLSSVQFKDQPAIFHKTRKLILCDNCDGSGLEKENPEDRGKEPDFFPCQICGGHGRIYTETIVKVYMPSPEQLRKFAK